jgi:hypothetical protein
MEMDLIKVKQKVEALEEHLSKRAFMDAKVWSELKKTLPSRHHPTALVEFVDVSLWVPDPEEGRWLAWQLQILLNENENLLSDNKTLLNENRYFRSERYKERQEIRRLSRREQKLRRQLRVIQHSKTWRLARKLGHLRAQVLRKPRR